jgi:hypothetical protein
MMITPGFYRLLFGLPGKEFADNIHGMISCCTAMGVYPLSGVIYTLRERKNETNPWSFLIGGAISGVLLFILYFLISLVLPPGGFKESISQILKGFQIHYADQMLFGVVGSIIGSGMALLLFASMGGTTALFLSLILKTKNE